jgi:predicted aconitase with swiveling domain
MGEKMRVYKCRGIVKGRASGEAIVSKDAMCFYLCDPQTGEVIERNHPIQGRSIAGKVLVVKSGKGSSVVQVDGFYQLWVKNNLPAAIILKEAEPVIVSSAVVTSSTMVDRMEADPFEVIEDGDYVEVDADAGEVRVGKRA